MTRRLRIRRNTRRISTDHEDEGDDNNKEEDEYETHDEEDDERMESKCKNDL